MGISSALYSGVSGLNTDSQAMTVLGNNLANTSTVGFKGSRTVFSDLLSSTIYGSGGASQVGRGVGMSKVDTVFSQGTFQSTDSDLDVAIEGSGFFLLKKVGDNTTYYSRAGAFRFDQDGYLVNPEGLRVQGKAFDTNGNLIAGDPTDIQVSSTGLIPANVTTTLSLNTNLDASSSEISVATPFDYTNTNTFNYSSSTQVYDTLGNPHLVTLYFRKLDENGVAAPAAPTVSNVVNGDGAATHESADFQFVDLQQGQSITIEGATVTATGGTATAADIAAAFAGGATSSNAAFSGAFTAPWTATNNGSGNITVTYNDAAFANVASPAATEAGMAAAGPANTWNWYWTAQDATGNILGPGGSPNAAAGTITFQPDGTLATPATGTIAAGDLGWGNGSTPTGIGLTFDTTQFNSDSVVISQTQNGYAAGNLTGVTIDKEGAVTASYSNGVQRKISNLVLAKFNSPNGLEAEGTNLFVSTTDSGTPRVGLPGTELGKIFTNSLEQSNVDMGQQFVEMITLQRAFQANSKIITTIDELLNTVINLKQG